MYQQARKGFIYFIILWLIFFKIYNMLGEKQKQVVSTRTNDANKIIDWMNCFYLNCDWTRAWQAVMSNEFSQRPIDKNSKTWHSGVLVYILAIALLKKQLKNVSNG